MCWVRNKVERNFVQWVIIPSDCTCEGKRHIRELRLYENATYELYVMSKKVESFILRKEFIDNLFEYCVAVPLCRGFEVEVEKDTHDRHGNVIGSAQRWEFASGVENSSSLRHSSKNCSIIVSSAGHSPMCTNCATLKSNSFYGSLKPRVVENTDQLKSKRESFMSNDEIIAKLHVEKKRRVSAERREKYTKESVLSGMKVFHLDDHSEFKCMFNKIDENTLHPEMKFLWEVQRDIIQTPSSKGFRWHPK